MAAKAAEEAVLAEPSQPTKKKGGLKFFILLLVYVLFLLLGAAMFMYLEFSVQEEAVVTDAPGWLKIKGYIEEVTAGQGDYEPEEVGSRAAWLQDRCPLINNATLNSLFHPNTSETTLSKVEVLCGKLLRNVTLSEKLVYSWSFIDALYFSMTVTTTIGYGHIAPTRPAGKVMCMLYAVVGVPLTGILLAFTSDVFGEKVYAMYRSKLSGQKQRSRVFIVAATVLYLLLGFVVFLFLPAVVFVYVEGWSYLDSIYYAFITLTTIGFGDIVTGRNMESGVEHACYQLSVIAWIITSLGYWVMVANFITRVLRSKKLHASLIQRAKLLKVLMDKQSDPFLPQRSKYTMNFMMQLSSMLAVDSEGASELQLNDPGKDLPLADGKTRSSSVPMGIPGIASLFNLPQSSPSGLNTQICKRIVNSVPDGGSGWSNKTEVPPTNSSSSPPSPSPTAHSLNTTVSTVTIDCDDSLSTSP